MEAVKPTLILNTNVHCSTVKQLNSYSYTTVAWIAVKISLHTHGRLRMNGIFFVFHGTTAF